jgi:hypothetical protein
VESRKLILRAVDVGLFSHGYQSYRSRFKAMGSQTLFGYIYLTNLLVLPTFELLTSQPQGGIAREIVRSSGDIPPCVVSHRKSLENTYFSFLSAHKT